MNLDHAPSLFEVTIIPKRSDREEDQKQLLEVKYRLLLDNLRARRKREGRYLIQRSLSEQQASPEQIDDAYRRLNRVERGFREIKNVIRIRPVYHWKSERIRAHVLICFLAYVLVNWIEERFRENGIDEEVVPKIRYMDKLKLVETQLSTSDQTQTGYSWTLGEVGTGIQKELKQLNWWRSIQAYKSSVRRDLKSGGCKRKRSGRVFTNDGKMPFNPHFSSHSREYLRYKNPCLIPTARR